MRAKRSGGSGRREVEVAERLALAARDEDAATRRISRTFDVRESTIA